MTGSDIITWEKNKFSSERSVCPHHIWDEKLSEKQRMKFIDGLIESGL